jgi:hypothetical protein
LLLYEKRFKISTKLNFRSGKMQYHEQIANLANLLKESKYNFVLTGAGISTEG